MMIFPIGKGCGEILYGNGNIFRYGNQFGAGYGDGLLYGDNFGSSSINNYEAGRGDGSFNGYLRGCGLEKYFYMLILYEDF